MAWIIIGEIKRFSTTVTFNAKYIKEFSSKYVPKSNMLKSSLSNTSNF
jgi:hypothetical protein